MPAALLCDVPDGGGRVSASLVRSEYTASSAPQTTTTSPTSGPTAADAAPAVRAPRGCAIDEPSDGRVATQSEARGELHFAPMCSMQGSCERADTDLPRDAHTLKPDWALPLAPCVGHLSGT